MMIYQDIMWHPENLTVNQSRHMKNVNIYKENCRGCIFSEIPRGHKDLIYE
jgi:hypothetical protein